MPTARHLDAVTDGYRSTYWKPPTSQDVPPRSPDQRERLRVDLARREYGSHGSEALAMTKSRTQGVPASLRASRRDPANFAKDSHTQNWLDPVHQIRSLPTNVTDPPHTLNTNMLRSERKHDYVDPLPEGGHLYNIKVNSDNFVEERFDKMYKPGVHSALARPHHRFQSEYMDRIASEAVPSWQKQRVDASHVMPQPAPTDDFRLTTHKHSRTKRATLKPTPDYIYYAREGFGPIAENGDATLPKKQGSPWVGTAPQRQYESVTNTQMTKGRFEFQKRFKSDNIRNTVCETFRDGALPDHDHVERWATNLEQGEKHAQTWKSTAQADFVNFSGHRAAPNLGIIASTQASRQYEAEMAARPAPPRHKPNVWKIN